MISALKIKNFKSHKDTYIEFYPGVNVIVGETDAGKSVIISALRWAITNRPLGDSFVSYWGDNSEVKVVFDPLICVTRKKEKESVYILEDLEGELVFKAFASEVPEEIAQAINMNDANLQSQFESHFLLSKSAGEVAIHFNKVARLDKIDQGLKYTQSKLLKTQRDIESDQRQLDSLQERLKGFDYLPDMEERIDELEDMAEQSVYLTKARADLQALIILITTLTEKITIIEKQIAPEKDIDIILSKVEERYSLVKSESRLEVIVLEIESFEATEKILTKSLEAENKVEVVIQLVDERDDKEKYYFELDKTIKAVLELNKTIRATEKLLEDQERDFHESIGEECPLCGSKL